MAAQRKLQGEIDKTLKKIQEGIELFEEVWQKVHACENENQKEKLQDELKKEIKKQQRLREQVKAWITGADIKDKQPLMDARKAIEKDMERFKELEKEAKKKGPGGGKGGMGFATDPKEQAKNDARDWINDSVSILTTQVELFESELEELSGNQKKGKKPPPRLTELEGFVSSFKEHVSLLEKVLRCVDNDTIQPEELEDLKADLQAYQDSAEEEGNPDPSSLPTAEDSYALLMDRIEAVDAAPAPVTARSAAGAEKGKAKDKEEAEKDKERERERERERAAAAAVKAQLIAAGVPNVKLEDDGVGASGAAAGKAGKAAAASPAAAAAASTPGRGAAQPPPPPAGTSIPATPTKDVGSPGVAAAAAASPARASPGAAPSTTSPLDAAASPAARAGQAAVGARPAQSWLTATTAAQPEAFPQLGGGGGGAQAAAAAAAAAKPDKTGFSAVLQKGMTPLAPPPAMAQPPPPPPGGKPPAGAKAAAGGKDAAGRQAQGADGLDDKRAESGKIDALAAMARGMALADAAGPSAAAPAALLPEVSLQPLPPAYYPGATRQVLEACFQRALPQHSDVEWKSYRPRHPTVAPPSYPKAPADVIDNAALFRKLDAETLFFAFYHQPDTYQQYLAAQELKRQSWRFHKQHMAWFQRFAEPSLTTEEFEQGTYIYFDYNIMHDDLQRGWCYRQKENFTFKYDALEDELQAPPA